MDAVVEARTWLNTPFQHQGCLKGVACDCIGLVKGVGMALGLVDYDPASETARRFASYSMQPNSQKMREGLATWLVPIPVSDTTLADILFMAWGREPQHVALITDMGIIHSYSTVGRVVEHSLDVHWKRRIVAAYRYPYFVDKA
ncbi:MAG: peptidase P60 [Alphaproteobacteria bacterium]|nr:peptidase P60 [Alphaproteobacteria bacterium]